MTSPLGQVQRWTAFPDTKGKGAPGNPAGVVLNAAEFTDADMQAIAREVGYSETAFVTDSAAMREGRSIPIRYFSPDAEVPFCGHATIATAVALATDFGTGTIIFATPVGDVSIVTEREGATGIIASFRSVEPWVRELDPQALTDLLDTLSLHTDDLDVRYPPRLAFAGNPHPVITITDAAVFDGFTFDPAATRSLMDREGWSGTIVVQREVGDGAFDARNLFPVGDITEDPATGSAAAAVGAYLRALGKTDPSTEIVIRQGGHVGRPCILRVMVPTEGGIIVTGGASRI